MRLPRQLLGIDWEVVGVLGLVLFAGSGLIWPEGARAGVVIMAVAVCACRREALCELLGRPVFLISLAFASWVLVRALLRYLEAPQDVDMIAKWSSYYLVASGLPALPVALVIAGDRSRILLVLCVALVLLLAVLLTHASLADLQSYMAGERAYFGLGNAVGLYICTALLGLVLLIPWERLASGRTGQRSLLLIAVVVLAVLGLALLWHQNRSALLALLAVFPVVLWRHMGATASRGSVIAGLACLLVLVLGVGGSDFGQRFTEGLETARMAVGAAGDALPENPSGARIRLWRAGLAGAAQHPVIGIGPGNVPALVDGDPAISRYSHLHNLYLQMLVELGGIGLLLYLLVLAVLLRAFFNDSALPSDLRVFILGALALFLLVNLTQVRIDGSHAMYYVTLVYALVMTGALHPRWTSQLS